MGISVSWEAVSAGKVARSLQFEIANQQARWPQMEPDGTFGSAHLRRSQSLHAPVSRILRDVLGAQDARRSFMMAKANLLTVAPAAAGKGVFGRHRPAHFQGSVFVTDPRRALGVTAKARAETFGQQSGSSQSGGCMVYRRPVLIRC